MSISSLEDALFEELKDILHAEKQITKALPKMAKKASNPELKKAFEEHLRVTEKQIERLEQVFELLDRAPRAKKCEAMQGILDEGKEHMQEDAEPEVLDAMMIGDAQKVEHYEIASYGTAKAWAEQLGLDRAVKLLQQTLDEEKETDQKLNQIAEKMVNQQAVGAAQ
jgi:ferritin-like metal-binding protein YciE